MLKDSIIAEMMNEKIENLFNDWLVEDYNSSTPTHIKAAVPSQERAKLGILKPNTSEYSKYVSQLISYYRPKEDTRDFPSVTYKTIKVPMTAEQYKIYTKAQKKVMIIT